MVRMSKKIMDLSHLSDFERKITILDAIFTKFHHHALLMSTAIKIPINPIFKVPTQPSPSKHANLTSHSHTLANLNLNQILTSLNRKFFQITKSITCGSFHSSIPSRYVKAHNALWSPIHLFYNRNPIKEILKTK